MEKIKANRKSTTTGNRGLCKRGRVLSDLLRNHEQKWSTVWLELTTSHENIFQKYYFRTRRPWKNQSIVTAGAFGVSKTGGQESCHIRNSKTQEDEEKAGRKGSSPHFMETKTFLRKCRFLQSFTIWKNMFSWKKFYQLKAKKEFCFSGFLIDVVIYTQDRECPEKEDQHKSPKKPGWKSRGNLADPVENFWFSFL